VIRLNQGVARGIDSVVDDGKDVRLEHLLGGAERFGECLEWGGLHVAVERYRGQSGDARVQKIIVFVKVRVCCEDVLRQGLRRRVSNAGYLRRLERFFDCRRHRDVTSVLHCADLKSNREYYSDSKPYTIL
jgi:hypothetical protein